MSVKIKINIPLDIIEEKVHNDKVGLFMATTCAKAMHDFTPAKTYALADTTTIEPWKVTYEQEMCDNVMMTLPKYLIYRGVVGH